MPVDLCLLCGGRVDGLHQWHIKCAADGEAFRENGGSREHRAVSSLFIL